MFLFILESIGTSELAIIGIVALMFLGPRKLPEMARKFGKIMAEFRGTANEFKETWQREVNFEEEAKALNINELIADEPIPRVESIPISESAAPPAAPAIKEIDPSGFEHLLPTESEANENAPAGEKIEANDKKNWL